MAKAKAKSTARKTASATGKRDVVGMKGWLATIIVLGIPAVGLVMGVVWAAGKGGNLNRRGLCKAYLLVTAVLIVLLVIFYVAFKDLLRQFVEMILFGLFY